MLAITLAAAALVAAGWAVYIAFEALDTADKAASAVNSAIVRESYRYDAERSDDPV